MNVRNFGLAAGAGGIGAGLLGMLGGNNNPYDSASSYYDQIPGAISPYFQSYVAAGKQALPQLQGQYSNLLGNYGEVQNQFNNLMNDPNATLGKIGGGFKQSPGYQWQLNQGLNAANNAAAAGGMLGTPQHQQQAAGIAEGLANQDYYNYLNHALGLYNSGLQGNLGFYNTGLSGLNNINQMGYNASNELAGALANSLMNQGNLSYAGQAAENQSEGSNWGDLFGGAATLAAFLPI